ncbi:helix-hairpin-helix domain-containing protein [candidate division WOR-3 bacterium]|nr:helix-hairpin-helix domain-containing protein [candidate division WOR-3 bacterium]
MNDREKTVVIFLVSVLVVGAGISFFKKSQRSRVVSEVNIIGGERSGDEKLDINQATAEQLEALPGIGSVIAQRIVEYREKHGGFKTVDELLEVTGIGPKRLAGIKDFVVCNPP